MESINQQKVDYIVHVHQPPQYSELIWVYKNKLQNCWKTTDPNKKPYPNLLK